MKLSLLNVLLALCTIFLVNWVEYPKKQGETQKQPIATDSVGDRLPDGFLYRLGTIRLRHWVVSGLQFMPNGKQLVSAGWDDECFLWDVATGKLEKKLTGPFPGAISPGEKMSAHFDKKGVSIREWPAGKVLHQFPVQELDAVVFVEEGKILVGLTRKNTVYRWDLVNGKELSQKSFALANRSYWGDPPAGFSPDGRTLYGVLEKDIDAETKTMPLRFWDVASGRESQPSFAVPRGLYDVHWTPDGQRLITQALPYGVEIWDLKSGKKIENKKNIGIEMSKVEITVGDPKTGQATEIKQSQVPGADMVAVTPDGQGLLLPLFGDLALYDLESGKTSWRRPVAPIASGPGLKGSTITRIAFSPVNKTVAVGCSCGHIALLDWTTGENAEFSRKHPGFFSGPLFSPDGNTMLIQEGLRPTLSVRDVQNGQEIARGYDKGRFLAWSPDGERLAFAEWRKDDRNFLVMTSFKTGKKAWEIEAWPYTAWFSADGKNFAFKDLNDRTFHLVDPVTGNRLQAFVLPPAEFKKGADPRAISPDLKKVAVQLRKAGLLQVWDMAGKKLWTWPVPEAWGKYWNVQFLPGNRHVMADSYDSPEAAGTVVLLDVATGKKIHDFKTARYPFLAASADGKLLALRGRNKVEVREVETGKLLLALNQDMVRSSQFVLAPNNKRFAYNLDDYTVEVRELPSGKLINKYHRPWHFITDLAFSPDNQTLAIAYNDSTIWMWQP